MNDRLTRGTWLAGLGAAGAGLGLAEGASAQSATTVKVGIGPIEAQAQGYYAKDMGYFAKSGLNVELSPLRAGTAIAAAVVGGDLQFGCSNVVSLGSAHSRGIPFVIIAPGAYYDSNAPTAAGVVAPNAPYKSAKELSGKIIGGISVGGLDQVAMWAWIDKSGGNVSTLKYVELNPSAMADAVAAGRVDACSLNDPDLSAAVAAGKVRILGKAWDAISKLFIQTAWFTTRDYLAQNKETVRRFQQAIVAAGAWANANPVPAAGIIEKYILIKEPRATVRFATKMDPGLIQVVYDTGTKYKFFAPTNAKDFIWDGK